MKAPVLLKAAGHQLTNVRKLSEIQTVQVQPSIELTSTSLITHQSLMELMKLKGRMELFQTQHPKFSPFLARVGENALLEGTVMELKVTTPEGKEYITNIRLTSDDIESIQMARSLKS